MKIKKPKRIMSLFLAALMCVTSLVGMGTTAYAAEETDDVYLISFPRDGDSNYNAEWGHGSLTFMNGWKTGTSRYTTVRVLAACADLVKVFITLADDGFPNEMLCSDCVSQLIAALILRTPRG